MRGVDFIQIFGLYMNTLKEEAYPVVNNVITFLEKNEAAYLIEENAALLLGREDKRADYKLLKEKVDLVIVFGGDGTFLHASHHFFNTDIPLLGINIGHLGFLTEIETDELTAALSNLLKGNYKIEKRMMLNVSVFRSAKEIFNTTALNDLVIHRGGKLKMISLELYINNEIVHSYRADGLIITTPTGSTAYSLSAGGPIVNPQVRAIILTPICPHTLFMRPMVISDRESLKVKVEGEESMRLTADGRANCLLEPEDEICLSASEKELSIIRMPEKTFYTILHKKMKLGLV